MSNRYEVISKLGYFPKAICFVVDITCARVEDGMLNQVNEDLEVVIY
jgi:hypothetical protein